MSGDGPAEVIDCWSGCEEPMDESAAVDTREETTKRVQAVSERDD